MDDVARGGDILLALNLVATFVFGISGGLAAVRARLDLFGVVVLAAVVGLAGGIVRDVLIGVPPATFRDSRYLLAAALAGPLCAFGRVALERLQRAVLVSDALGLSLFCVTGATKALAAGVGPVQAVILGAVTGIGGGMLRDVLLSEVPIVLRSELYAIPALAGASVVAAAHEAGYDGDGYALIGAAVCFAVRLLGIRYGIQVPRPGSEDRER